MRHSHPVIGVAALYLVVALLSTTGISAGIAPAVDSAQARSGGHFLPAEAPLAPPIGIASRNGTNVSSANGTAYEYPITYTEFNYSIGYAGFEVLTFDCAFVDTITSIGLLGPGGVILAWESNSSSWGLGASVVPTTNDTLAIASTGPLVGDEFVSNFSSNGLFNFSEETAWQIAGTGAWEGCNFIPDVPRSSAFAAPTNHTFFPNTNGKASSQFTRLTFNESTLPSGSNWSVTLNGNTSGLTIESGPTFTRWSHGATEISFEVTPGSYTYSATAPGYASTAGAVTVATTGATSVAIIFESPGGSPGASSGRNLPSSWVLVGLAVLVIGTPGVVMTAYRLRSKEMERGRVLAARLYDDDWNLGGPIQRPGGPGR